MSYIFFSPSAHASYSYTFPLYLKRPCSNMRSINDGHKMNELQHGR